MIVAPNSHANGLLRSHAHLLRDLRPLDTPEKKKEKEKKEE